MKVILVVWDSVEHSTVIAVASTQEKAWELLGREVVNYPHCTASAIQFFEVEVDQDFSAYYEGTVGKCLNPKEKKAEEVKQ